MTDDNSSNPPKAPNAPPESPKAPETQAGHDLEQTGFLAESAPPPEPVSGHNMERTGFIEEGSSPATPESAVDSDLALDSFVDDRYRIEEKLGEGAMGTIYLVKEIDTRENLAIKTLSPALRGNPNAMKSMAKEVATARKFSHPNLLQIYTLETRGQLPYLVMEYVDGGDLEVRRRAAGGKLSEQETCEKTLALLEALDYLHERSFVHLDVKPQNVMLTRDGKVKLTDYGIAKSVGESNLGAQGTPLYMAPELIHGNPTDRRTDIYAVGVMFYFLLMGRFPFGTLQEATPESVRAWHLDPQPKLPHLPEKWQPILLKCLARDAANRFGSCGEMIDAIRRVNAKQIGRKLKHDRLRQPSDRPKETGTQEFTDFVTVKCAWCPNSEQAPALEAVYMHSDLLSLEFSFPPDPRYSDQTTFLDAKEGVETQLADSFPFCSHKCRKDALEAGVVEEEAKAKRFASAYTFIDFINSIDFEARKQEVEKATQEHEAELESKRNERDLAQIAERKAQQKDDARKKADRLPTKEEEAARLAAEEKAVRLAAEKEAASITFPTDCASCGKTFSSTEWSCPHCGKFNTRDTVKAMKFFLVFCIAAIVFVNFMDFKGDSSNSATTGQSNRKPSSTKVATNKAKSEQVAEKAEDEPTPEPTVSKNIRLQTVDCTAMTFIANKKNPGKYTPSRACDWNSSTAWQMSWKNNGQSVSLTVELHQSSYVSKLVIANGAWKDSAKYGDLFPLNARIRKAILVFDGNVRKRISFRRNQREGTFEFTPPIKSKVIRLEVLSIHRGDRWKVDLGLSEVKVYGHTSSNSE